jgi:hypothetical protein
MLKSMRDSDLYCLSPEVTAQESRTTNNIIVENRDEVKCACTHSSIEECYNDMDIHVETDNNQHQIINRTHHHSPALPFNDGNFLQTVHNNTNATYSTTSFSSKKTSSPITYFVLKEKGIDL